ncbi:MAG: ATP-grasp domain-containing protein, partial [Elusimicrobiaceae bacterium]|nr:ATP-grasp domain-containing protein [Elusimicrobiaceae bacterium]
LEGLKQEFPESSSFVLQKDFSCGGSGTFLFKQIDDSGFNGAIPKNEKVMVTPYMTDNVSVNVHCVIYEEEVVVFPPSIQLVDQKHINLEYLGSDFSAYNGLTVDEKVKVRETALNVAETLRKKGYRGVCGIDLILAEGRCYFMEINSRFQASTALLNRYLYKQGIPCKVF